MAAHGLRMREGVVEVVVGGWGEECSGTPRCSGRGVGDGGITMTTALAPINHPQSHACTRTPHTFAVADDCHPPYSLTPQASQPAATAPLESFTLISLPILTFPPPGSPQWGEGELWEGTVDGWRVLARDNL